MRIAVGGIHTECSTYSPIRSRMEDFRLVGGAELPTHPDFAFLADYPFEILPALHARALPGGPVARNAYEALKRDFLERLEAALPVDGLYLAMHGAMAAEGMDGAEGDWLWAAREVVGGACPIAASYDPHGNVSQRVVDQAIERLPAKRITRPAYPFDRAFDYRPTMRASARAARLNLRGE
jgi:microcystin degradation protein MlrC